MDDRLMLQKRLEAILESKNVYFQPPSSFLMEYPAIVYELDSIENTHADNCPYVQRNRYSVTLIDKNPDSVFLNALSKMPKTYFDRHYIADNLHHYVLTVYY